MNSAVSVLRTIANRLGCECQEVEQSLLSLMGGDAVPVKTDPEERLEAIRTKLGTEEAGSVIASAAALAA